MESVFFYGLFMDADLLRGMGVDPLVEGAAELPDYALRIGDKATLVAAPGSSAWGIVMSLRDADLGRLYSSAGVERYRPEPVAVVMADGRSTKPCTCYNIPAEELGKEVNSGYAEQLAALAARMAFPGDYVREIGRFCE